ncbi:MULTISPECIES: hypothetical protein [unclassified Pseudoclavibacter]|uniref:hypothetical protein n=1 Tax=unclassified Pseudoclavibacter TaxID=2615177 RepID=UPI0012F1F0BB|nr:MULTISPECIES: hypothetical protein [unclassified Pseudoclavibacter]MBF4458111.1 hypothetical protein [Pseudoclavibacter sp. VKM Ac-2867]VXB36135.1 conserved hypothetical protein [Pseudoclavibacter sp. 8L]
MSEVNPSLTVEDLLQVVELDDIVLLEVFAQRSNKQLSTSKFSDLLGGDVDPEYELGCESELSGRGFRVRLRVTIETEAGPVRVEVAAEYTLQESLFEEYQPSVIREFAQFVGFFAVVPYAREAVASVTQRVFGAGLLMPIIKREEIELIQESAGDSEATPGDSITPEGD